MTVIDHYKIFWDFAEDKMKMLKQVPEKIEDERVEYILNVVHKKRIIICQNLLMLIKLEFDTNVQGQD